MLPSVPPSNGPLEESEIISGGLVPYGSAPFNMIL